MFVLEVAARPIGGLCARVLRLMERREGFGTWDLGLVVPSNPDPESQTPVTLEDLLLLHALGEDPGRHRRASDAAGVMMIPIPRRGVFAASTGIGRRASGAVSIDDVRITAKPDQLLVPLPEGASYLGFIFARAASAAAWSAALREAHARLVFAIDARIARARVPRNTRYNPQHG